MASVGKQSQRVLDTLREYESRNVTFMEADTSWPIVWDRAKGVNVWDADGKKYLDLTAAFGVAAAGHANAKVVASGAAQMKRLLHAMGDVHPHARKAELARELSRITFERWNRQKAKTIFCNSGFEAVEAALKTAVLATGKPGVIAFTGAYHGLGYGALNITHREHFRSSFRSQLARFGKFVRFPDSPEDLIETERQLKLQFAMEKIGAILVEPIQARGGINIPPPDFLPLLRTLCNKHGAILILDEIYTGFGRTGKWFACEHAKTVPDLICLGKALSGGFPISACVGSNLLMDKAWPVSSGEAIHTSTFLGHPVGCAMALAQIEEIRRLKLFEQSHHAGRFLQQELAKHLSPLLFPNLEIAVRGVGLMFGVELRKNEKPATGISLEAIKRLLHRGFIFLPEGEHANVISFTPALTISQGELRRSVRALAAVLLEMENATPSGRE